MLLPLLGAGLGGYEAYRQSGGNLGATALGAGLGFVTPGALRMAGSALGAGLAGTGLAARAGTGLMGGAAKLGQVAASAPGTLRGGLAAAGAAEAAKGARILSNPALAGRLLPAIAGGAAVGGGMLLGAPSLAGGLAANVAGPVAQATGGGAQLAAGALGYQAPGSADYTGGGGAVPPVGQFGAGGTLSTPLDVLTGTGMGRRLEYLKDAEAARDAMRVLYPEVAKISETAKKREFERNMAAAGIRQNIATAAQMLMQSQLGAQQMGQTAAQQAGQALTQQYQYS